MVEKEGRFTFCVAAIIENSKNEILIVKRSPGNSPENIWDVVGGRVEQFEGPINALYREVEEETGITDFEILKMVDVFWWYKNDHYDEMIGVTFWCKTNTLEVKLSKEHQEFKWIQPKSALELSEHPLVTNTIKKFIEVRE